MTADFLDTQLVAYLSLREALGFQMRVETVLLPEFVAFVKTNRSPVRSVPTWRLSGLARHRCVEELAAPHAG